MNFATCFYLKILFNFIIPLDTHKVECMNELSPNRSTWATDYIGTLYTHTSCNKDSFFVEWTIGFYNGINDSVTYLEAENGSIYISPFKYDGLNLSVEKNDTCWTSKFEVTIPLNETMDQSYLQLTYPNSNLSFTKNISVQDCETNLTEKVTITSSSNFGYNATGQFSCTNKGELFYSSGIKLPNRSTTCLESAQWLGQSDLQCWSAPIVTLLTSLKSNTGVAGQELVLSCDYVDTTPSGNETIYFIDSEEINIKKGNRNTTILLKREHNGINVSCQAFTPYTEFYKETGKSPPQTLYVLYNPNNVSAEIVDNPSIVKSGSTVLLNSSQTVELTCTSDANPPANCTWMLNQTQISTSCNTSYQLYQSGSFFCTANNEHGSNSSTTIEMFVVTERSATVSNTEEKKFKEGLAFSLECSINFQNELNTTFTWITPTSHVKSAHLQFNNASRNDSALYTCQTFDDFGFFSYSYNLSVLYAPGSSLSVIGCSWEEVQNQTCYLNFTSNPPIKNYTLSTNGLLVSCDSCKIVNDDQNQERQSFVFALESTDRDQLFLFDIRSSEFPNKNLMAEFQISLGQNSANNGLIIATCVVAAILVMLISVGGFFLYKRKFFSKSTSERNVDIGLDNITVSDDEAIPDSNYATVDLTQRTKKSSGKTNPTSGDADYPKDSASAVETDEDHEERTNPIYVCSEESAFQDTYTVVKKIKSTPDKEERTNPIYVASDFSVTEETYAVVDKGMKTPKVKEEHVNPIYVPCDIPGTEETYASVDRKNKGPKAREEHVNPLYVSNEAGPSTEEEYDVVDKTTITAERKKEEKQNCFDTNMHFDLHSNMASTSRTEEELNTLYGASYQTSALNEDTYAQVHKHVQKEEKPGISKVAQKPPKPPIKKKPILQRNGLNEKTE